MTEKQLSAILEEMEQLNQHLSDKISPPPFSSKLIFILLLFVALFGGIIGYLIGVRTGKSTKSQLASQLTPSSQVLTIPHRVVQTPTTSYSTQAINNNRNSSETVYFLSGQAVLLKYKGRIYIPDNTLYRDFQDASVATWQPLLQAPSFGTQSMHRGIFSFQQWNTPLYDFLFIMQWDETHFDVYIHRLNNSVEKVTSFTINDLHSGDEYKFPHLRADNGSNDTVSDDGNYVAFDMNYCWYCEAGFPSTLLFNIQTKATKKIGKVSYFKWKDNGAYEYKDYVTQPCQTNPQTNECQVDPQNLPLRVGKF